MESDIEAEFTLIVHGREVFFTADDFGMSEQVNCAILHAHRYGGLHGASLMMGQAATEDAVRLARENPQLQVGWHLHLCDSQPVTRPGWPWGTSPSGAGWTIGLSSGAWRLMRDEVAAQWELFAAMGLPCAFVNSHHHLHAHPMVYRELLRVLPRRFRGWLRLGTPRFFSPSLVGRLNGSVIGVLDRWRRHRCPFRCSQSLWGIDRIFGMRAKEIRRVMAALPPGLHEFMFHPRNVTGDQDLATLIELKSA